MKWIRSHCSNRGVESADGVRVVPSLGGEGEPPKGGTTCLRSKGFTLVELLAAMVFMAIVIPVAVQGLRIATRAGEVGQRKAVAARVLDRELNEYVAMSANQTGSGKLNGTEEESGISYKWKLKVENWNLDSAMRIVRCEVTYPVQGKDYSIEGSTLVPVVTQ
jgi:type II secretion system protein I